jgi:hypothetical protein
MVVLIKCIFLKRNLNNCNNSHKPIINVLFVEDFDVVIFMRMKKVYGTSVAQSLICEKPLHRWVHMDGSKLSFRDSFKIVGQIGQIAVHYR